ncbi:MAG: NAD+ synthase [Bacteroidia bacterium]
MKIALAQLNYHTGNFEANTAQMLEAVAQAKSAGADLIVFAELSVTGYPPRDFLEFEHFLALSDAVVGRLAAAAEGIAIVMGAPARNRTGQGKPLFNAAYFLESGEIRQTVSKTLLPTYDVFDEYRYFEPGSGNTLIAYKGIKLALSVCEDLWNVGSHARYARQPLEELGASAADLIINIAASPFSVGHDRERAFVLGHTVQQYQKPLLYVNHVGAQTELIFDGHSHALNRKGEKVVQLAGFAADLQYVHFSKGELYAAQALATLPEALPDLEQIHQALCMGIRDYFRKLGFKKAIIGLSGGIDSALVTALAAEALGPENVHTLLMPSRYSSDHSINDSLVMVKALGVSYDILPIEGAFQAFEQSLSNAFAGTQPDITEENLQSRIRGVLLMAYTNKFGYILLNTSNKSELAVGYGTLYGDMCGGLSVIGDLYKTEVYALSAYLNRHKEIIPDNIITKAPSAELRPDQKDSDSLPDYELLDKLLYHYIEERQAPEAIRAMGYNEQLVNKVMRLVNINEYKRHQTPPILRVSHKAFGMGRRVPIVAKYLN